MSTLTGSDYARAALEFKFQETVWEGCVNLDCIPGCRLSVMDWRCERFEQAFETYLVENHPKLAKVADLGGAT